MQQIEVCNLPNNNTTLAFSDIYITFQSCVISFMTYFYCFHHSLDSTREVNYPIVIYYHVIGHNFGVFLMHMSELVQYQQFRVGLWEVDC